MTEADYIPMLKAILRVHGYRDLDWAEAVSAAGLAYTRASRRRHLVDEKAWPSYLWRTMQRELQRALYRERKRGLAPRMSTQHDKLRGFSIDAQTGEKRSIWYPSRSFDPTRKVLVEQCLALLKKTLAPSVFRAYLSIRVLGEEIKAYAEKEGVTRQTIYNWLATADERVEDLRARLEERP